MPPSSSQNWSLRKSLAFLAATFAIMLGTLLPTFVAASPILGSPVVLCGGSELRVILVDDHGQPVEHDSQDSLGCAMALLSGLAATPVAAPVSDGEPVVFEVEARVPAPLAQRLPPARGPPLRPPSTAPPIA